MLPYHAHLNRFVAASSRACSVAMLASFAVWLTAAPAEAAHLRCAGGDVACLVSAINLANANGRANTITLDGGVYSVSAIDNIADGPNGLPSVSGVLTIKGAGAELTTIERDAAAPLFRLFHVARGGSLILDGVTVRGGIAGSSNQSGAVLALGHLTVANSIITENGGTRINVRMGSGGGVAGVGGVVVIRNSTISHNYGLNGGGVSIAEDGSLTSTDSEISANEATGFGAGILFISDGTLALTDTAVTNNLTWSTGSRGGGVFVGGKQPVGAWGYAGMGTTVIARSTIGGNRAVEGGGLYLGSVSGKATITKTSIINNYGYEVGGGVAFVGTLTVTDTTIANNRSDFLGFGHGGGGLVGLVPGAAATVTNATIVQNYAGRSTSLAGGVAGNITLANSIVAANTATNVGTGLPYAFDCSGGVTSLGHNLFGDPTGCNAISSDVFGDAGLGAFVDPGQPGTAHVRLLSESQAIDAGDNEACGPTDQLGLERPVDGDGDGTRTCDIGAVEFYPRVNELVTIVEIASLHTPPSRHFRHPKHETPTADEEVVVVSRVTNVSDQAICNVAFEIVTLTDGDAAVLLAHDKEPLGGKGLIVPATNLGVRKQLRAGQEALYRFTIALPSGESPELSVNVLGEPTVGGCGK